MSMQLTSNNGMHFQSLDSDWTFRTNRLDGREEQESMNALIKSSFYGSLQNDNGNNSAATDISFASNVSSTGDSGIEVASNISNGHTTTLSSASNDSSGLGSPSAQLGDGNNTTSFEDPNTSCYSPFSRTTKEPLLLKIRPSSPVDNVAFNTALFPHLNQGSPIEPPRFPLSDSLNSCMDDSNDSGVSSSLLGSSVWSPSSLPGFSERQTNHKQTWSTGSSTNSHTNALTPTTTTAPSLTTKQTLECLEMLQELQQNNGSRTNASKAMQTSHLSSVLQQHLLSQLLSSPTPQSPTYQSPQFNNTCYSPFNRTAKDPLKIRPPSPIDHVQCNNDSFFERNARFQREAAGHSEATFTWSGQLPRQNLRNPTYSCKVFLGGCPWDITEAALIQAFKPFGNIKVEWPGKDGVPAHTKGYVYIIFENEKQVKHLLQNCTHDYSKGVNWYFKISSKRMRSKDVQVIPWNISDSNHVWYHAAKLDPELTIFVGALHGMLNAEGLATVMQDLFGGVVHCGIDTDRHKYPVGSARLSFNNYKSYIKAVAAAFVEIKTPRFCKKVQVDPYLQDSICSECDLQQGPYFCRDFACFRYFCRTCFHYRHATEPFRSHRVLMRNSNKPQGSANSVLGNFPFNNGSQFVGSTQIQGNNNFGAQPYANLPASHIGNGAAAGGNNANNSFRHSSPLSNGNNNVLNWIELDQSSPFFMR